MTTLTTKEKIKRLEKVKAVLDGYEITSLYNEPAKAAKGASLIKAMKTKKIDGNKTAIQDDNGFWIWNKKVKVTGDVAEAIFKAARARSASSKPKRQYNRKSSTAKPMTLEEASKFLRDLNGKVSALSEKVISKLDENDVLFDEIRRTRISMSAIQLDLTAALHPKMINDGGS